MRRAADYAAAAGNRPSSPLWIIPAVEHATLSWMIVVRATTSDRRAMGQPEANRISALTAPNVATDMRRRARITVCHYAIDNDDAARLLAMLGLDGPLDAQFGHDGGAD